jgi:hypothetical protein
VSTLIKAKHDTWLAKGLTTYKYENTRGRHDIAENGIKHQKSNQIYLFNNLKKQEADGLLYSPEKYIL